MNWGEWAGSIVAALLSASISALVVYYFGIRQLAKQRSSDFRKEQLSQFYAPLAGMRKQVRAKSELRLKVSQAANAAWQEICEQYRGAIMHDHEDRYAPFRKIIEYENTQLESELLPIYREMLKLFTERYHLAETETREFYDSFVEFVEIWNRWMAEALPGEVLEKLNHGEEHVLPFYEHLEKRVATLQSEITAG